MKLRVLNSGSRGNACVWKGDDRYLVLDAGVHAGEIVAAVEHRPSTIAGVLLTHEHKDHVKAVPELVGRGVKIYCSDLTAHCLGIAAENNVFSLTPGVITGIGEWKVYAFETVHDARRPLGYVIARKNDRVLYATDTAYIPQKFNGITHMIAECNYMAAELKREEKNLPASVRRRIAETHMSAENLAAYIQAIDKSRLRQIILAHISEERGDIPGMKAYIGHAAEGVPISVAGPGYTYDDEF